jgi:hypothetical protein
LYGIYSILKRTERTQYQPTGGPCNNAPTDHLRFLTGVEALTGLLLIAWSGAYLFAMMNRLWDWPPCAEPDDPEK